VQTLHTKIRPIADQEPASWTSAPRAGAAGHNPAAAARLSTWQSFFGFGVLSAWLLLFAGGILVDTEPYRRAISPSAVEALDAERGQPAAAVAGQPANAPLPQLPAAWLVVVICFAPLNLAWLCVAASMLGAFGSVANLSDDDSPSKAGDTSNPYTSALLRGFFVYLFMMSGLLLLDDAPFANAGPAQYIRLAGFLSLFSFVVSYQPRLFTTLMVSAFQRIQARGVDGGSQPTAHHEANTVHANVDVDKGTVDVAVVRQSAEKFADSPR
jgi:hypothetical protein